MREIVLYTWSERTVEEFEKFWEANAGAVVNWTNWNNKEACIKDMLRSWPVGARVRYLWKIIFSLDKSGEAKVIWTEEIERPETKTKSESTDLPIPDLE